MNDQITYNGQPVNFKVQGSGPWIVLLHGFLESIEVWNDMANYLADRFSVLMIDLPGHGRSGLTGEEQTIQDMAGTVRAVMAHNSIDRFIICGHSMGGYVSLEVARQLSDKIQGLILFHSHAAPDDEKSKENRDRTINIVKLNHSNFIQSFISEMFAKSNQEKFKNQIEILRNRAASTSGKAIISALTAMRDRPGSLDILMVAAYPILYIIGKEDSRMQYDKILAQTMLSEHSECIMLNKVGHMGFIEAPDKIFPVVKDFCSRNLAVSKID